MNWTRTPQQKPEEFFIKHCFHIMLIYCCLENFRILFQLLIIFPPIFVFEIHLLIIIFLYLPESLNLMNTSSQGFYDFLELFLILTRFGLISLL
jgi:hypothetical protein